MSTTCPLCAEPLPGSANPVERCPACGERLGPAAEAGPVRLPTARVLTAILGVVYLGLGGCCGLTVIVSVIEASSMAGASGGMVDVALILSLVAALCLLHVAAGLGLILGQEPGRKAAIACAVVDLLIGLLAFASGIHRAVSVTDDPREFVEQMIRAQLVGGAAFAVPSVAALFLLRRAATREAFQARGPR